MAMTIEFDENSRFTDLDDELVDHILTSIEEYENKPLLPLIETIKPISGYFNDIENYVYIALHSSQNPADDLTQEESASIHLYTMQFHNEPSLYLLLNRSLRAENRQELKPWLTFLKLFLPALYKLPSQRRMVWCGVKNVNLSSKYKIGTKFVWWGVNSCTTDIEILKADELLGKKGQRTIFSIECINGKSISNHSYFKNTKKEIILMPGSYFEVVGQLNPEPQLYVIQLKEIEPPITFVNLPFSTSISNNSFLDKKWKQDGITVAGGNGEGNQLNQFSGILGISIDDDQTLYIADQWNHRIIEWKSNTNRGQIVVGGNGNLTNQLNYPIDVIIDKENNCFIIADSDNRRVMQWSRENNTTHGNIIISNVDCWGLAMDKNESLYVCDYVNHEVRRWKKAEKNGTIVAGGHGKGNKLNQLNYPTFIFVDDDDSLYVSDSENNRVMKWMKDAKKGIVVAGGNGKRSHLKQLSCPSGVIVDQFGQIYVVDALNHRVMCWCKEAEEGTIVVGGNGEGKQSNQFDRPRGLSFDRQGNLYVVDQGNHRIQKFEIDRN